METPRLRSGAFPNTPQTSRRSTGFGGSPGAQRASKPLPEIPALKTSPPQRPSDPLVPEHLCDAPTQRLFAVSVFILLFTWKLYDWNTLRDSEEQSLWLFMKWVAIDGSFFLFALPSFRIPWLEFGASTMMLLFSLNAILDGMLMFQLAPNFGALVGLLGRSVWGAYELAVNEHSVNPDRVLLNESLILGRQIIHVLPEGSAILNQDRDAFCIDDTRTVARLPITINATNPVSMDLLRIDLDTRANETIHISKSQIKTMHKDVSRMLTYSPRDDEPKTLYYTARKPGLYVLAKVLDESNLEVSRKRLAHTVVVACPKAAVRPRKQNQCRGEISSIELEVTGTPPLTLKYRKLVNKVGTDSTLENIMPDDFNSPFARQHASALVVPNKVDVDWAKAREVTFPLTESLATAGNWSYSIQSVTDVFGNTVSYSAREHEAQERHLARSSHLHQVVTVHERPNVYLQGCSAQQPLKVAKGKPARLPLQYGSSANAKGALVTAEYHIDYAYSPQSDAFDTGDLIQALQQKQLKLKPGSQPLVMKDPGLYTITGVSTEFCKGEVLEPASCLLQNPPQPQLSLSHEEIFDRCAGSPVGLRVDLNLIGSPPFTVTYRMKGSGNSKNGDKSETINGLRGHLELKPSSAGHYTYEFVKISDAVYKDQALTGLKLEQDVKPSASARFVSRDRKMSCINEVFSADVDLQGEGPFIIEYELVHAGRRVKSTLDNIEQKRVTITTPPLTDGGEYTLVLLSVMDRMGCKESLPDEETKVSVRHQKPKVAFRTIDGSRSISTLEDKLVQLPLRLEGGDGPWTVRFLDKDGQERSVSVQNQNDRVSNQNQNDCISVKEAGTYRLTDVRDATCPGTVDEVARDFEVKWIARPELRIPLAGVIEHKGNTLVRADVCEGDDDAAEVLFKGTAPFTAKYVQHVKPDRGTMAPKPREIRAALNAGTLRMDTNQPGFYEYKFTELRDANYDHSAAHFTPLTVQQRINSRPSAAFTNPGKTYSFCSTEAEGEQVIPLTLHGTPPFDLELELKHQGTARPETIDLTGIRTHAHNLRIPHARLQKGQSAVSLRRVRDSNNCVRSFDSTTGRVQVAVHDAPSIAALEPQVDFCVGDRLNFALSGVPPFNVFYEFENSQRKAVASATNFRRLAEKPGTFAITGIKDSVSPCEFHTNITKHIHGMPSVRVSQGRDSYVDIHEGGEAEILFEFGGTPPFEFTYTRSSNTDKNGRKSGTVLDTHAERSTGHTLRIRAHEEGTYEVVSIRDRFCAYSKPGTKAAQQAGQKKLGF